MNVFDLPEPARSIFMRQYYEIRGPWEREDFDDRLKATLKFYAEHKWDEASQRWERVASSEHERPAKRRKVPPGS